MRKSIFLILGFALLLTSTSLFAAGVSLTGVGARATALGGSYRGISDDWSAMFWNPAGMTQITGLEVGMSSEFLWPVANYAASKWNGMNFSVTRQTETESDAKTFVIPSAGVVMPLGEKLSVGLGVWAPFGLGATWDLLDTQNYNSLYPEKDFEDDLMVLDIHPTIAYKLDSRVSIGIGMGFVKADIMIRKPAFIPNPYFGMDIYALAGSMGNILKGAFTQYGALEDKFNHFIAESKLKGDGTGYSANLGLMLRLTDKINLGLSGRYYSDIELDGNVDGTLYFPLNESADGMINAQNSPLLKSLNDALSAGLITQDQYLALTKAYSGKAIPVYTDATAKATLPLPSDLGIGLSYKAIDKEDSHLFLSADFMYTKWSAWDIIDIEIDGIKSASKLIENWEDMYRLSFGLEYKFNPMLTVRGSYYTEQNAAIKETLTPTIPDINTRNVVNLGLQLNLIPGLALHASYEKILIGDTEAADWNYSSTEGDYLNMAGKYKMSVNNVMFGLGYNFGAPESKRLTKTSIEDSKVNIGVNVGLALPTGDMGDAYKSSPEFGVLLLTKTANPIIKIATGGSFTKYLGKSEKIGTYTFEVEDSKLYRLYLGPQIGKEIGGYILPAIAANFDEEGSRYGLDLSAGYLFPLSTKNLQFNINLTYSMMNLIGKEEGEKVNSVFRIGAGLLF